MAGELRLGASANITTATASQSFADLMSGGGSNPSSGTGQLRFRRSYTPPPNVPSSWNATPAAPDVTTHGVDASWWSVKGTLSTWLAGGYDSNIIGVMDTMPAGHTLILTVWHEPETDGHNPFDWRQTQKRVHRLVVENRGSKDVRYAQGCLTVTTPHPDMGGANLADWLAVYESGDSGAFAPPTGFGVGDPAWDLWGYDWYDRYPDNSLANRRQEWLGLPAGVGNTYGLSGVLDLVVAQVNTYPGATLTRSGLVWGVAEMGTEREGTAMRDWYVDVVEGMRDDSSQGRFLSWFESSSSGTWAPFRMSDETQIWIRTNGALHSSGATTLIGNTLLGSYGVAAVSGTGETVGASLEGSYGVEAVGAAELEALVLLLDTG